MICSETEIRVLYAHTDKMGIVSNSRYLEYFEAGRNSLLRTIYPYTELEKINIGLPVIEAHANYLSSASYDDVVLIKSFLKTIPSVKVKIDYELYVKGNLIVTGYTVHCFINLSTMKPVKPPDEFIKKIKSFI
ncbi:MAG: acyl-CoA thioesterase [Ignavibacteria bacterium]|nr:acyl-CoA thioesterase [Ignavibacteria bacterium]